MYLDPSAGKIQDAEGPRYTRSKTLEGAKREAFAMFAIAGLDDAGIDGQIGIYDHAEGGRFYGYVIKNMGQPAYFEPV